MIKNYFIMKKAEWKVKSMIYGTIVTIIENQKDISELLRKMYLALKDVSVEDLKQEFIVQLAEIIHEENASKND